MADINGNLWLCTDCFYSAEGLSAHELGNEPEVTPLKDIPANWELLANWDSETNSGIREFAMQYCDGCDRYIGDTYHRYSHIEH